MSRPPLKALEQIKNYCNKTQCRKCYFGERDDTPYDELDFVGCTLQRTTPCDWDTEESGDREWQIKSHYIV